MIPVLTIEHKRVILDPRITVSVVRIGGAFECFFLEDPYRPANEAKVPGRTCIPCGEYDVEITWSPKFKVMMPLVFNVQTSDQRRLVVNEGKTFEGIRIHPGFDVDTTDGCLQPGKGLTPDAVKGWTLAKSRDAYDSLFARIHHAQNNGQLVKLRTSIVT